MLAELPGVALPLRLALLISSAHVDDYDVPIDVNSDAAGIEISPDHTTITYSHIAFTLKETLFATPCSQQDGTGVMALFEISSIRPMTLTLSFMPEMKDMWPAPISGELNAGGHGPAEDDDDDADSEPYRRREWKRGHTRHGDCRSRLRTPPPTPGTRSKITRVSV